MTTACHLLNGPSVPSLGFSIFVLLHQTIGEIVQCVDGVVSPHHDLRDHSASAGITGTRRWLVLRWLVAKDAFLLIDNAAEHHLRLGIFPLIPVGIGQLKADVENFGMKR